MQYRKAILFMLMSISFICCFSQNNSSRKNKGVNGEKRNTVISNKAVKDNKQVIPVFQPYLLKARQLFFDGKDTTSRDNGNDQASAGVNLNNSPVRYLPHQSLPINNSATINNDGSGNWGNQNSLYGNCLDVMTGAIMVMSEAAKSPQSADLLFFAPGDGQNTYYLMSPEFARNNSTATYMTDHVSDQVTKWSDVNESEVALTKLTIGQFNKIQNNNQLQSAVMSTQNYAGYYSSPGQKLDGKVFAVKVQMNDRQVVALIAVLNHYGTTGSNGYLKIQIKTSGLTDKEGLILANSYLR
jgi:hypothetical protein